MNEYCFGFVRKTKLSFFRLLKELLVVYSKPVKISHISKFVSVSTSSASGSNFNSFTLCEFSITYNFVYLLKKLPQFFRFNLISKHSYHLLKLQNHLNSITYLHHFLFSPNLNMLSFIFRLFLILI
jgi:hypothetical protein